MHAMHALVVYNSDTSFVQRLRTRRPRGGERLKLPRRASRAGRLPCATGTEQGRLGAAGSQTACGRKGYYAGGRDPHTDARAAPRRQQRA
jgi:hypothetical protein